MKSILSLPLALAVSLTALPAQAHSELIESFPAAGAVLEEAPDALRLVFSQDVELVQAAVKNGGGEIVNAAYMPPDEASINFTVVLPPLKDGSYVVEWTAVGKEDGHTVLGDYSFAVGGAPASAAEHDGHDSAQHGTHNGGH